MVYPTAKVLVPLMPNQNTAAAEAREPKQIDDAKLLTALLENTPDGIYFKDAAGRFVRISASFAKRLRLNTPQDAIGKTDRDFFNEEQAQEAHNDENQIICTGVPVLKKEEKKTWGDNRESW